MAGGAGLARGAGRLAPELLALLDPQHAGIDGEVVLLRLRLGRDELAARAQVGRRNGALGLLARNQQRHQAERQATENRETLPAPARHVTVIRACSLVTAPC